MLVYLAYSLISIAYQTWGAQLGDSATERVRITATREAYDIADVVAESHEAGKDTRRDGAKLTAVKLFGVEGARRRSLEYQHEALDALACFGPLADNLRNLVNDAS